MRVIDSHVHLYPPELNREPHDWAALHNEAQWAGLCLRRRRNGAPVQGFPTVEDLLREMDVAGVERAVLLGWYWSNARTCELQNRFYAECVRTHPDRLSAFATIQPGAGLEVTLTEVRRARDDGMIGLGELSPHSQSYNINSEAFGAALSLAAEFSFPVTLHVTDPNSREYPGRVETPLKHFIALAAAFPRVEFILAHWGGLLPLRDVAALQLPNIHYDTAASPLIYDDSVWQRFLAVVPPTQVLFGSDFPLNLYPKRRDAPEMVDFAAEARAASVPDLVMSGNAARLFRL